MKTLLIIGHTYPEPTTTAAGIRMMQLISLFNEQDFDITFACTALPSEKSVELSDMGINLQSIQLNHSSFDEFIGLLKPIIVLFDRYITEEQFGWRVAEQCPEAMRILDTEDLHFLRKAREEAINKNPPVKDVNLFSENAKRELASIYRCDVSLIISEAELEILQQDFKIEKSLLYYLPLLEETPSKDEINNMPSFEERKDFITIGNFLHAPNVDSVKYLKKEIWPLIKKQLPDTQLHIYGAYANDKILALHDIKSGFLIKGWAEDVDAVMSKSKICLAPLRFGAGLKGKLLNAMKNGTPSITTSIGCEGINANLPFSGNIADTAQDFAKAAVALYSSKTNWLQAQQNGFNIIEKRFRRELFSEEFKNHMHLLQKNLIRHRKDNFIGQILQHHTLKSTKYMSKWIQEKNS